MNRLCLSIAIVLALLAFGRASAAEKTPNPLDAKVMKVALHAGSPEEEKFIDYVLWRVDKKGLPLELVESTFLWAKKKPRNKFQYFKHGLKLRAAAEGFSL